MSSSINLALLLVAIASISPGKSQTVDFADLSSFSSQNKAIGDGLDGAQSAWYPSSKLAGLPLDVDNDLDLAKYLKQLASHYDTVGDQAQASISEPVNDPDSFSVESRGTRILYDLYTGDLVAGKSRMAGSEYIDQPLALAGHQYVQGGAGEGRQLLGPDGSFENIQVIKSDQAVPAYCEPPNPCPAGFTAADGCLEKFVNSASFSREYQVKQRCSCDNEHSLFNCAAPVLTIANRPAGPSDEQGELRFVTELDGQQDGRASGQLVAGIPVNKLKTLARTIQNRFGGLESIEKLVKQQQLAS